MRPDDDFLKLGIGSAEKNAAPGVAIARDILQEVTKQEITLTTASRAAEE